MKRAGQITIVLAAAVMLITGCEEQLKAKKSRLIAAENMRLKKELEQSDKIIEKQKELTEKCMQRKKFLEEQAQGKFKEQVDEILKFVMEENAKVRDENNSLKAQIQELESQVERLEKELRELKKPDPQPL